MISAPGRPAWGPDTVACGYQLGRALAEPYWALDPALDTDKSPAAWQFLLGRTPPIPSAPADSRLPMVPSKRAGQNAQLVDMARQRSITPVTPN